MGKPPFKKDSRKNCGMVAGIFEIFGTGGLAEHIVNTSSAPSGHLLLKEKALNWKWRSGRLRHLTFYLL